MTGVKAGVDWHHICRTFAWRTHITERLNREKGFNFIAEEGDWPECYRLNQEKVGFYGQDVYSLWESTEVITQFLQQLCKKLSATEI